MPLNSHPKLFRLCRRLTANHGDKQRSACATETPNSCSNKRPWAAGGVERLLPLACCLTTCYNILKLIGTHFGELGKGTHYSPRETSLKPQPQVPRGTMGHPTSSPTKLQSQNLLRGAPKMGATLW
jgi:hypothetical protein